MMYDKLRLPWRLVRLSVLLPCVTLTACQSMSPTPSLGTDASFCSAARAIYYSRHDTKPTIQQIKEHNAVGLALKCGWLKP